MKMHWSFFPLTAFFTLLLSCSLYAQDVNPADSTGLPGDNFSLEAALDLFKKSASLEDFEKKLNAEDNGVNNLDLNEDGQIDYVRVIDRMDGDAHAIVLQVPVSASESQDVAVIELEKDGAESATLQIVGDEDIYGQEVIAEPFDEEATQNDGRHGPAPQMAPAYLVVNVWAWPAVRFVYRPAYVVYVSPWRWGYYPTWWRPFRPHPWRVYYVRVRPYRVHYHVVPTHRVVRAHTVYNGHRTHSTVVHSRTVTRVNGRQATRTQTTVEGRHGREVTKTQTTVEGRRGREATKTQTTVEGRRGREATKTKTTVEGKHGRSATKKETKVQGNGRRGRH